MTRSTTTLVRVTVIAASVAVLVLLCTRFGFSDVGAAMERVSALRLLPYLLLAVVVLCGHSVRWWLVARAVGSRLPLTRFIGARLAGEAVGSLLPGGRIGGDPLRVALLYADGSTGVRAGAAVAMDRVMELTGNTAAVVMYLSVYAWTRTTRVSSYTSMALVVTLGLLLGLAMAMALPWTGVRPVSPLFGTVIERRFPRLRHAVAMLRQTEDQLIRFLHEHPGTFIAGLCGTLCVEVITVVEFRYLFAAFDLGLDLPTLLMVLLGSGMARAIPTPAGLGALETSQVTVLAITAGRPDIGFVVGMILRLHDTVWLVVGLIALALRGVSFAQLRVAAFARTPP